MTSAHKQLLLKSGCVYECVSLIPTQLSELSALSAVYIQLLVNVSCSDSVVESLAMPSVYAIFAQDGKHPCHGATTDLRVQISGPDCLCCCCFAGPSEFEECRVKSGNQTVLIDRAED